MNKKVSEVFKNINIDNDIKDAMIEKLQFSKKLNTALVQITSEKNITLTQLIEFEKQAATAYELQSFKIQYKYIGKIEELTISMIKNILLEVSKSAVSVSPLFKECEIVLNENNNVEIGIKIPQSEFLILKGINNLIERTFYTRYGFKIIVTFKDLNPKINNNENIEHIKTIDVNKLNELINTVSNENNNVAIPSNSNNISNKGKYGNFAPRDPKPVFEENAPDYVIIGKDIKDEFTDKIIKITDEYESVIIEGQIIISEPRKLKSGKYIYTFDIADKTSAITCKMFLTEDDVNKLGKKLKAGNYIKVSGRPQIDSYSNELTIMINSINEGKAPEGRKDCSDKKRVELHMHTQMSSMDAVSSAKDIIKQAIKFGHKAVAITDHGVVQAFPEAHHVITDNYTKPDENGKWPKVQDVVNNAPIKILYGVEGYLVQDVKPNIIYPDTYCVFDIETTGFKPEHEKITEIACCKVSNGKIIDEFSTFVNPEKPIPKAVAELTHITDDMVKDAPKIDEVLPKFLEFIKDSILVAHNAKFDVSFIKYNAKQLEIEDKFNPIMMDTLMMAKELYNCFENNKLRNYC